MHCSCLRHQRLLGGGDCDGELERDDVPEELRDALDLEDRDGLELTLRLRPRAGLRGAGDRDLDEDGERGRRRAGEGERLRAPAPESGTPLLRGLRRRAGERGRGEGLLLGLGRLPPAPVPPRGGLLDRLQYNTSRMAEKIWRQRVCVVNPSKSVMRHANLPPTGLHPHLLMGDCLRRGESDRLRPGDCCLRGGVGDLRLRPPVVAPLSPCLALSSRLGPGLTGLLPMSLALPPGLLPRRGGGEGRRGGGGSLGGGGGDACLFG